MVMIQGCLSKFMKRTPDDLSLGERTVLGLVQSRRATSQIQIARHLGVSTVTVHNMIQRLLEQKILEQSVVSRGKRGRPLLHYRVCLPAPILAIQWLGTTWHGGVIHPDERKDFMIPWDTTDIPGQEHAIKIFSEKVGELLSGSGLRRKDVLGCVISINAARVRSSGKLSSSVMPWVPELQAKEVGKALGCRVWIFAVSMAAETELALRAREGVHSLCVLNVADGVSAHACVYSDAGSSIEAFSGEIGHIIVERDGLICGCGHRGCLETVLSGSALQRRAREDVERGIRTGLESVLQQTPKTFFDALERLHTERTDSYAVTLAEEFLERCAWALSVIYNIYDPDVVVLTGYGLAGRESWKKRLVALAPSKILHGEQTTLRLEYSRSDPREHLRRLAEMAALNQDTTPL